MPDFLGQATVSASGMASVDITHNLSGIVWEVQQISVTTAKVSSACTAFIKKNGSIVTPSATLTPIDVGQATTAAGLPYVYLSASDKLTVQVQGASFPDTLTLWAQYREWHDTDPGMIGR